MLSERLIRCHLGPYNALPMTLLYITDSTNLQLKSLCRRGDSRVQLLCAQGQTLGRGRLGRSFLSPEGTGVYMSLLLPLGADDLPLTIRAGVAVCRAVEEVTGQALQIKWVNDLFLKGKKVCGILAEGTENMAVLGIGLNLKTPEGGFAGVPIAGALERQDPPEQFIGRIAFHVLAALEEGAESILADYRERMFLTGKEITFTKDGQTKNAHVLGVDASGGLVVQTEKGRETLRTGEVSIGSHQFSPLEYRQPQ